jgi:hypothetical protein
MTDQERYRAILANHLPVEAVDWVYAYLDRHKVHFHISRRRNTKLGDYRWIQPSHPFHEISVNGDLNPYLFLMVFLHEAAHLETHLKYHNATPHGHEWQAEYASLLRQHSSLFPAEVRQLLASYTSHIPLHRPTLLRIEDLLHTYDKEHAAALRLDSLPAGSRFRLVSKPELLFENIERRRTRWLCREIGSGRQYLVNGHAEVTSE